MEDCVRVYLNKSEVSQEVEIIDLKYIFVQDFYVKNIT